MCLCMFTSTVDFECALLREKKCNDAICQTIHQGIRTRHELTTCTTNTVAAPSLSSSNPQRSAFCTAFSSALVSPVVGMDPRDRHVTTGRTVSLLLLKISTSDLLRNHWSNGSQPKTIFGVIIARPTAPTLTARLVQLQRFSKCTLRGLHVGHQPSHSLGVLGLMHRLHGQRTVFCQPFRRAFGRVLGD